MFEKCECKKSFKKGNEKNNNNKKGNNLKIVKINNNK